MASGEQIHSFPHPPSGPSIPSTSRLGVGLNSTSSSSATAIGGAAVPQGWFGGLRQWFPSVFSTTAVLDRSSTTGSTLPPRRPPPSTTHFPRGLPWLVALCGLEVAAVSVPPIICWAFRGAPHWVEVGKGLGATLHFAALSVAVAIVAKRRLSYAANPNNPGNWVGLRVAMFGWMLLLMLYARNSYMGVFRQAGADDSHLARWGSWLVAGFTPFLGLKVLEIPPIVIALYHGMGLSGPVVGWIGRSLWDAADGNLDTFRNGPPTQTRARRDTVLPLSRQ
ncbi:hypothetical protein T439DRAFT_383627 [Meredithblackwellia eburnea MCA 4105]